MTSFGRALRGAVLVVVALLGLAAAGLWALSRRESQPAGLMVTGTIEARDVDLSAKTTARVAAIRVEEGSHVRLGELVIQLDDAEPVADVARLEAGVRVAQAQLRDLLAGARKEEIAEARAQASRAEAALADLLAGARREEIQAARQVVAAAEARQRDLEAGARAQEIEQARSAVKSAEATRVWTEREFERIKSLYDRDLVAAADKDRAWQTFEVARMQERTAREQLALVLAGPRNEQVEAARAEVRAARERLRLIEAGPRPGQVDTARAQLVQAEAALAQARARLADTRIEAPMDGVVLRKNLEPGATAAAGAAIVTLVDPTDLWLRAYIAERDLGRVRVRQTARVTVDSFPGQPFEGRVTEVASEAEFTPRNVQTQKERVNLVFRVRIAIANPDGRLKPGMPADAVIATD
jgi:HlyD family secretion protein